MELADKNDSFIEIVLHDNVVDTNVNVDNCTNEQLISLIGSLEYIKNRLYGYFDKPKII